jgi:arsenate reductase-like glutaredoxin family protein
VEKPFCSVAMASNLTGVKKVAQKVVNSMFADGQSEVDIRAYLKTKVSKSRVTQLMKEANRSNKGVAQAPITGVKKVGQQVVKSMFASGESEVVIRAYLKTRVSKSRITQLVKKAKSMPIQTKIHLRATLEPSGRLKPVIENTDIDDNVEKRALQALPDLMSTINPHITSMTMVRRLPEGVLGLREHALDKCADSIRTSIRTSVTEMVKESIRQEVLDRSRGNERQVTYEQRETRPIARQWVTPPKCCCSSATHSGRRPRTCLRHHPAVQLYCSDRYCAYEHIDTRTNPYLETFQ